MIFNRWFFFSSFFIVSVFGQNINYAVHDLHTLTVPKNKVDLSYSSLLMNDTVDILKIKESEFGNNTSFDSIGDLKGNSYKLRYGITNDLMLNLVIEDKNIDYSSSTLRNKKKDIFLRYNLFNNPYAKLNSGISLDIGYVRNKLDDLTIDNITDLTKQRDRILSEINSYDIQYSDGITPINNEPFPRQEGHYIEQDGILTPLDNNDYNLLESTKQTIENSKVLLKNTQDKSKYIRFLTGYYNKNSTVDFFIGYKKTKIDTIITLDTLNKLKKLYDELELFAIKYNKDISDSKLLLEDLEKNLNREEKMYMIGMNYTLESKNFIYEFGFEYNKFIRDSGLDYIDFNYIFDLDISYKYSKEILIYAGTKIMYRQLNGEIPYLYNQYTQTSYDHMYGYTKFGIQYSF